MQYARKTTIVSALLSRRPCLPRRYKPYRFRRMAALTTTLGIAALAQTPALHADTFNWLAAPPDMRYENPLNWINSGGTHGVPGAGDDAFNANANIINYLLSAGSRTLNSFTNSGGGTFNINLSDTSTPTGQNFVINGDVNNLLNGSTPSLIDITGVAGNAVTFNNSGGTLTNAGIIRVHDGGFLASFADDINNSGTFTAQTGATLSITQGNGISDTLNNSGTMSALSGGLVSIFNTTTNNAVNALLNADGVSGDGFSSNLGISAVTLTNDGTIQATNGGFANIFVSDVGGIGTVNNSNLIQADGTGANAGALLTMSGSVLNNNSNAFLQAINGNGATVSVDFTTINNGGVIMAADTGSTLNINAVRGNATLTNTFTVGASSGGLLNDYSQTINNYGYLTGGNPSPGLGYTAFRNGQLFVYGDIANAGTVNSVFNNGDIAGTTPGWVHAYSDLSDTDTYIRIDSNVNNNLNSHITSESVNGGDGFQRIDLNVPDTNGNSTNLVNAGTIEALTGGHVRSYASTLLNNTSGILVSDGVNANGANATAPRQSSLYLGDNTYLIPNINNSGTIRATNGGGVFVDATLLTNNVSGVISSQGFNADLNGPSSVYLGNYADNQNQQYLIDTLNNAGELSARAGGFLKVSASTFNNTDTTLATDATAFLDSNNVPITSSVQIFGPTLSNSSAGVMLAQNGGALTINSRDFGDLNFYFSTFANAGSVRAEGVGQTTQSTGDSGEVNTNYVPSIINLNATNLNNGVPSLSNTGTIAALNGGLINAFYFSSFTSNGTLNITGTGLTTSTDFVGGGFNRNYQGSQLNFNGGAFFSGTSYQGGDLINATGKQINVSGGGQLGYVSFGNVVNNGSITVDGSGLSNSFQSSPSDTIIDNFQISQINLTPLGLSYDNGSMNVPESGAFTNTATISATNGGQFSVQANDNITNTGTLLASGLGTTVSLNGTPIAFTQASINLTDTPFTVTNGSTVTTIGGNINLNSGLVQATNGQISLSAVNITNAAPAVISGDSSSNVSATITGTFANAGSIAIDNNSAFTINSGSGAATTLLNNTGTITTFNGSLAVLNLTNGTVTNSGTIRADSASMILNAGMLTNQSGGTILAGGTGAVVTVTAPTVTNQGSINVNNGNSLTVTASNLFTTSGNVNVATGGAATFSNGATQTAGKTIVDGALTVNSGNIFTVQGGRLEGNGTISGAVNNTSGIVTPGSDTSAGHLTETGNYTQGANGALLVKLGGTGQGTSYDLFSVNGTATLAGQLRVQLLNSFTPFVGETFDVLTYTSHTGAFNSLFSLDTGYDYTVTYSDSTATLHVNAIAPVPETGTVVSLGLLMAGGAFALRRTRRQQTA